MQTFYKRLLQMPILQANGSRSYSDATNAWSYTTLWLTLSWNNDAFIDKLYIAGDRDWENMRTSTIIITGLKGRERLFGQERKQ